MDSNKRKKRIVVIGGGTGCSVVLAGLRDSGHDLTAVVTMADNGGSSGVLRRELGVLPPGDVRQCLLALSAASAELRESFAYRFSAGALGGHTAGNVMLAAAELATRNFPMAVRAVSEVLQVRGRVLPVTLQDANLYVQLRNGMVLSGEEAVMNATNFQRVGIRRLHLRPQPQANPAAIFAIRAADVLVFAPGKLYSTLAQNFLVRGIPEAFVKSRARKVYVANLMTQRGQTDGFTVHQFVEVLEQWIGRPFLDVVFYNTAVLSPALTQRYRNQGRPVRFDRAGAARYRHIRFIGKPLLAHALTKPPKGDPLAVQRSLIRHDPKKLAAALAEILGPGKNKKARK